MNFKSLMSAVSLAALIGGTVIGPANAQIITLGIQTAGYNGGALTTIGSASATVGYGVTLLPVGNFNFVAASAYGEANNPGGFISNVLASVGAKHSGISVLDVYFTETGLTSSASFPVTTGLTANGLSPGWTLSEKVFFDPTNGLFNTNPVNEVASGIWTATAASSANPSYTWDGASPYSVTEYYQITVASGYTGSASGSETVAATAVPELSTWAMMFAGFAGLGLVGFGRNRKARAA
jgi:hypothetical protein